MRAIASFDLRALPRAAGYLVLGGLGVLALTIPLFGFLTYFAGLLTPLLLAWFLYGPVVALLRPTHRARMYLFGNLGVLAATILVLIGEWIVVATVGQPNTEVTAPVYLAVVLAGLVGGLVAGARR